MFEQENKQIQFSNENNPFTELFSLLKRYENLSSGLPTLAYNSDELKVMYQHIDNAMDALLQGLQDIGHLMNMIARDKKEVTDDINNIGFFITSISNLTEALNSLRSDADCVLRDRGVSNY